MASTVELAQGSVSDALDALFGGACRSDAPGLIAGVSQRGRAIYRKGFGLASVQHGIANSPFTRVRIASASKQFTALAALLLAQEGKLDLHAPADRYLPGLRPALGMPSLRQFLDHTSGLRCTLDMGTLANGYAAQPPSWQELALLRQGSANFAPGQGQLYCNGTYHVLSGIIETASGLAFEEFLRMRIFVPLGMHDTESVRDDSRMVPGMASAHLRADGGGWKRPPADSELRGDGGMVSTLDDMMRWMAHLRRPHLVGDAETWRQLFEPAVLANGLRSTYAMGIKRHRYRGVEILHHSGGLLGLNCQMLTVPAHELDIFIAANGAPVSASLLAREVLQVVLGDTLLHAAPPRAPAQRWAHLSGRRYAGEDGLLVTFGEAGGALAFSVMNMAPAPVLHEAGNTVGAVFEDIGMGPFEWATADLAAGPNGDAPEVLPVRIAGTRHALTLLPRVVTPDAASLAAMAGTYRCDDLCADARIDIDPHGAVLHIRGDYSAWRRLRMEPVSPHAFALAGIDDDSERYSMTVDADGGAVDRFHVDTYRARRLEFVRLAGVPA